MDLTRVWARSRLAGRAAGALLLVLIGMLASVAGEIEIGPGNKVSGSCDDLAAYVSSTGVTDKGGAHPGRPGNTHATIEPKTNKYAIKYKPGPDGGVCASSSLKIQLKVTSVSSRLDWQPPTQFAKACRQQKSAWVAQISAHEAGHVKDNNRLVGQFNARAKPRRFEACENSRDAAGEKLQQQVAEAMEAAMSEMSALIEAAAEKYHAAHGASVPTPNCCVKGRIHCACDNPAQGKPRNYDSEPECLEKCPSGLRCFPTQCVEPK